MRRPQQKPIERKPTRDDELHAAAITHAAKRVVEHLRRAYAGRPNRQIGSLSKEEIMALTEDCVGGWCQKRVEQARSENVSTGQLDGFILGG